MNKKKLAMELSKLEQNEQSKLKYEQYATPGDIAADLLWIAKEDITGISVVDLGCGNGVLAIGAAILGAKKVTAVDIDGDVLGIAISNSLKNDFRIIFVKADIEHFNPDRGFDTCIMNPPFGIQSENSDRKFLSKAFEICKTIYSIHKAESGKFLNSFASEHGFSCELLKQFDFPIKATQDFHKSKMHRFEAGFWRFRKN
jgi:putative methylase